MRARFALYAALTAVAIVGIATTPARADSTDSFTYQFGGNTFTWELPASPTIAPGDAYADIAFTIPDVSFSENGNPGILGTMDFWSSGSDGGFDIYIGDYYYLVDAVGPQLYSGPECAPTFLTDTYSLDDAGNGYYPVSGGILQITPSSVPEPPAFSLLLIALALGFGFQVLRRFDLVRSAS